MAGIHRQLEGLSQEELDGFVNDLLPEIPNLLMKWKKRARTAGFSSKNGDDGTLDVLAALQKQGPKRKKAKIEARLKTVMTNRKFGERMERSLMQTTWDNFMDHGTSRGPGVRSDGICSLCTKMILALYQLPMQLDVEHWNTVNDGSMLKKYTLLPWFLRYPDSRDFESCIIRGSWVRLHEHNALVVRMEPSFIGNRTTRFRRGYHVRFRTSEGKIEERKVTVNLLRPIPKEDVERFAIRKIKPILMKLLEHIRWSPDSNIFRRSDFVASGQARLSAVATQNSHKTPSNNRSSSSSSSSSYES